MKKQLIKLIIWLFEKYAIEDWYDKNEKRSLIEFMKENKCETEQEAIELMIDKSQESEREAYYAGREDAMEEMSLKEF